MDLKQEKKSFVFIKIIFGIAFCLFYRGCLFWHGLDGGEDGLEGV